MDWADEIDIQRRAMAVWRRAASIVPPEDDAPSDLTERLATGLVERPRSTTCPETSGSYDQHV